jgi:Predicted nucleotide-binding protein containing TIR-like domain/Ricin-type beta-trefoil lectin domain-like
MKKSSIFIGSSVEALPVAQAIQQNLDYSAYSTIWPQGVFQPSVDSLTSLSRSLPDYDFAVFVFTPDDVTTMRDAQHLSIRDNVIFELGLFISLLGRERCFIVVPHGAAQLHIPTDLLGMTPLYYDKGPQTWQAALGAACTQMGDVMKRLDVRSQLLVNIVNKHSGFALEVRYAGMDDGDQIVQHPYNGQPQQIWDLRSVSDDFYRITCMKSGKCLEVAGNHMADDAPVHQRQYAGHERQQWKLSRHEYDGWFRITARHSSRHLQVKGASKDSGAPVIQYHFTREGGDEQKWWLWTVP